MELLGVNVGILPDALTANGCPSCSTPTTFQLKLTVAVLVPG